MRIRERKAAQKLMERFEAAIKNQTRFDTHEADQEYFEAKFELLTYIYKLGVKP